MAEYVVKVSNPANQEGAASLDLFEALEDFKGVTLSPNEGEIRDVDSGELDAIASVLAELRTAGGFTDTVTYHLCLHDEGIGDCSAAVEVR
jgi:hypothetical protein